MQNTVLVANFKKKKNQTGVLFLDEGKGWQGILRSRRRFFYGEGENLEDAGGRKGEGAASQR